MVQRKDLRQLAEIFGTFFKIGCFTFGGGYAMIPLIEREVIVSKKWVKEEDLIDVFSVAESIPGAIAINSSTFIGYKIAGRVGAVAAMLGVIMPSFIILTLIAASFAKYQDNPIVIKAFMGIRAAVKIGKVVLKDKLTAFIVLATIILVFALDIHPIYIILAGALPGITVYRFRLQRKTEDDEEELENDLH
jgi:chromate transporter